MSVDSYFALMPLSETLPSNIRSEWLAQLTKGEFFQLSSDILLNLG